MNSITVFYDHIRKACEQTGKSFEEIAELVTASGISGVEIEYSEICGRSGRDLVSRLRMAGLPVSCVYCNFGWESRSPVKYRQVIKDLRRCDIHNLLVIPGFAPDDPDELSNRDTISGISPLHLKTMKHFLPHVKKLVKEAAEYDINVVMEDYDSIRAPFGTSAELSWFLDRVPELGCAFDTGNFYANGEDAYTVLHKFTGHIGYVHCKDRSLTGILGEIPSKSVNGTDMYSSPVGSGIIPIDRILHDIHASGYTGPIAIEHFGAPDQLKYILSSVSYLRKALDTCSDSCTGAASRESGSRNVCDAKIIRVTVWNEFIHERELPEISMVYPEGIHGQIASFLAKDTTLKIRCSTMQDPEQGLSEEILNDTDVLIYWAHCAHDQISDEAVARISDHVSRGMGFIGLHSAHYSKVMRHMLGTGMTLSWKDDDSEKLFVTCPSHPIAAGVSPVITLPREELYGEYFDIPKPDDVVFMGWFKSGAVFRSGVTFTHGNGHIFYFQPGHEAYPIYYDPEIQKIITNAVHWAAPANMLDAPRENINIAGA